MNNSTNLYSKRLDFRQGSASVSNRGVHKVHEDCELNANTAESSSAKSIFLIGPMGAGKSTIGRALAQKLQWNFYDSDKEIERITGVSVAWIFDIEGEAGFRKREEAIIDQLSQRPHSIIATGGGAILSPLTRERLANRGTVIYLQISIPQQQERVLRNQNRPLLQQTTNVYDALTKLQCERKALYENLAAWTFCTDHHSALDIAQNILALMNGNR